MRILITGGFGFIGGRLATHLHQAGHDIVLASRTSNMPPEWLPQAEVVISSWNDEQSLDLMCSDVDVVIHAAGMNAQDSVSDPVAALDFNGLATSRLVSTAIRTGVKRFIYLSTAHVYNSPLVGKITEDTCPRNLHPYATSHLAGENVVLAANHSGKIEGIVTRLSNAFGSPADEKADCWTLLINDLCKQAVTTKKMIMKSSGLQRRNFVPITDIARAIDYLMNLNIEKIGEGLFNLGGDWTPTISMVAPIIQKRCKNICGFEPEIILPDSNMGEVVGDLDYGIDRLNQIGFQLKTNKLNEIDHLLKFCIDKF